MAFTNSPTAQTRKSIPIPFNGVDLFRMGDLTNVRDLQIVNFYYDRVTQENQKRTIALKKRPGIGNVFTSFNKALATDPIRGYFNDVEQNAQYWVVNNAVYKVKQDINSFPILVAVLNTSVGFVGFTPFLKSTNTRFICISDGTDLWIEDYVAVTCVRVTDADMPTPHQPYPVYIDGYLLLIKTDTSDMYNSDVDDPTSWTAGNFISAELNSDLSIRPIKAKNYVCILGYRSIEYFYDGANATGSPLSRNESPYRAIGYVTGYCAIGDDSYFVGQDSNQNLSVYKLNSFKIERVSNAVVDSTLQAVNASANGKSNVNLMKDGHCISVDGHTFYCLVTAQTTWVYDIEEHFWYEFKGSDGLGLKVEAAWNMYNGAQYLAIAGQTALAIMSPTLYQDFNIDFTCRYTIDNFNAETFNWKNCYQFAIIADQNSPSAPTYISLTWSDNDWTDGGTGITRLINLTSVNSYTRNLGRFRNRSWRMEYTDNLPLRISMAYVDINVGTQ